MTELLAVITITILGVISPGPDFAMVSRNSLMLSRRAGLLTSVGIGLGVFVHIFYTLLGVGLLIQQSLWLFNAIKLAGAIYLIYLGIKMIRNRPGNLEPESSEIALSDLAALRVGFLTNALNPKTSIFVISMFMQVINPQTPTAIQVGYGLFISLAHIVWFGLVALCFSAGTVRERFLAVRHLIDKAFGGLLIIFGAVLAATSRSS